MVKNQIARLGRLGLTVNISEMDVRVSQLSDPKLRSMAQRQIYHDIIAAALTEPAFNGIWLWGFTDAHTCKFLLLFFLFEEKDRPPFLNLRIVHTFSYVLYSHHSFILL